MKAFGDGEDQENGGLRADATVCDFPAVGMLTILLILAGCAGVEQRESPDSKQAAKLSLRDARLIVKTATIDFLPAKIVMVAKKKDNPDNPYFLVSCRYEELDPIVIENHIVNFGSRCLYQVTIHENAVAQQYATALLRWKMSTLEERQALEAEENLHFVREAKNYRAANPKPTIPEKARRAKVIAEAAVKEKRIDDAATFYEAGTDIAPWWADGHFNAALLCAELGLYSNAIHHMRAYLELVPNAPDAQSAGDQIIIWNSKRLKE